MLIPRFILSQDVKTVTIKLYAQYCALSELEVEVIENCFLFSCYPFYLRLTLPGNIKEDDTAKSSFDCETGEFSFTYAKAIEGEVFEDLEFVTKFLVRKVDASYDSDGQKITVLSGDNVDEQMAAAGIDLSYLLQYGFGFGLVGGINFKSLYADYFEVLQVNPFEANLNERRRLRIKKENAKFDAERYLCDLVEFEEVEEILKPVAPWDNIDPSILPFTNKELDFLKDLPNKVYNLSDIQVNFVHNSLVDILYAYCFTQRVMGFDESPVSAWTISTLSASLSWLDVFFTPREVVVFAFRRSLIYPLYRNFSLSTVVLHDLQKMLTLGEKFIIKCLIDIYFIFANSDSCRYILNHLFIKDYINYIMKWDKAVWKEYLQSFLMVNINKNDLGLNIVKLEQRLLLENPMEILQLADNDSDDASDESDSSDEDRDSSDESSESSDEDDDTIMPELDDILEKIAVQLEAETLFGMNDVDYEEEIQAAGVISEIKGSDSEEKDIQEKIAAQLESEALMNGVHHIDYEKQMESLMNDMQLCDSDEEDSENSEEESENREENSADINKKIDGQWKAQTLMNGRNHPDCEKEDLTSEIEEYDSEEEDLEDIHGTIDVQWNSKALMNGWDHLEYKKDDLIN